MFFYEDFATARGTRVSNGAKGRLSEQIEIAVLRKVVYTRGNFAPPQSSSYVLLA
jgi:hypothetical protein